VWELSNLKRVNVGGGGECALGCFKKLTYMSSLICVRR